MQSSFIGGGLLLGVEDVARDDDDDATPRDLPTESSLDLAPKKGEREREREEWKLLIRLPPPPLRIRDL